MNERISQIRTMLKTQPNDIFLHYSLAMELTSTGCFDEASEAFIKCIELDKEYLAAYVEAGKSLRSAKRFDEARKIFKDAMKLSDKQGENHTRDYIRQQLESLGESRQ